MSDSRLNLSWFRGFRITQKYANGTIDWESQASEKLGSCKVNEMKKRWEKVDARSTLGNVVTTFACASTCRDYVSRIASTLVRQCFKRQEASSRMIPR